ncbi:Pycsar system effector family protein [Pseudonocardia lacus]|uniref:Pycsar system effector family protein n=1 Tax=Pseudonocardia lacus TaxID=2835865 RepID=UPI001BDBB95B|nr:Pycsar system effector family protein [Pseudonocardia lacus]
MRGIEFGWRVHAVQEQWAARADTKATVVFTVQAAVIAAVVAAFGNAGIAAAMTGWRFVLVWIGLLASALAVTTASLVVIPQLGRVREMEGERRLIYFGHLRSQRPEALATRLADLTDAEEIAELSVQLSRMGAGNWRKYGMLRIAVLASLAGALLLFVAFAWPR